MCTVTLATIAVVLGAGVMGGIVSGWSLLVRVWRIEKQNVELQRQLISETKKRAVNGRWSKQEIQDELARTQASAAAPKAWWEEIPR